MNKKILVVATYFPPAGGVGSFRVTKFVKYLDLLGWKVSVLTVDEKFYNNIDSSLTDDISDSVNIYRLNFECDNKRKVDKQFLKHAKKNISAIIETEKPDYIYLTGGPFNILLLGRYIWNNYKIPYIIDLRDAWKLQSAPTRNFYSKVRWKLSRPRTGIKERYVFSKAKAVCTINDVMCNMYKKEYPKYSNKFFCIPNGYDNDDFSKVKEIKLKKFSIVYAGKFRQSLGFRNPKGVFEVIKRLNEESYDVELIVIGNKEQEIIDICNQVKCDKYCKFIGFKPHSETISYGLSADANLILTTNEKIEQTGKIFDCINFNKPTLVITDIESNLTKICKEVGINSIFRYDDLDGLYKCIKKIYDGKYKISLNKKEVKKYERKSLTKQLINIILDGDK